MKALANIHQTAPLGATNFIKVNNQYSEVIFVVFYYSCFIDYKLKSKTLFYKLNPVLREKSPKILGRKLKKLLGLWVKKYGNCTVVKFKQLEVTNGLDEGLCWLGRICVSN